MTLELALHTMPSWPSFGDARVLIVDDNPHNCHMLAGLLEVLEVGHVDIAHDGIAGLEAVRQSPPDLILLDVMMPKMNGLEMCRALRQEFPRSRLPVVFVTGQGSADERTACFAAGGTDMVSKPINSAEILARVGVHLENHRLLKALQTYHQRIDYELSAARRAQLALQPARADLVRLAEPLGLQVDGAMITSSELGGDFWTVFPVGDRHLGLLTADFTGHGVAAAVNVFRLHSVLGRLPRHATDPVAVLTFLNKELKKLLPPGQFATAFCGILEAGSERLRFANAGGPLPILVFEGEARFLEAAGPPLGVSAETVYTHVEAAFPPGAGLLLYSDGLIEAETENGLVLTEGELLSWVEELKAVPELANRVLERFRERLPTPPADDLTVVSLCRPATPTA